MRGLREIVVGERKFGGTTEEDWLQALRNYHNHADGLNLSRSQKLRFISVIFKGDAKTFYKS